MERRLDNVIYKMGFASSRQQARQQIKHSHYLLNSKKVDVPSIFVNKNDVISLKEASRKNTQILANIESLGRKEIPAWLLVNATSFECSVKELPARTDVSHDIEERMIVELYSK